MYEVRGGSAGDGGVLFIVQGGHQLAFADAHGGPGSLDTSRWYGSNLPLPVAFLGATIVPGFYFR